MDTASAHGDHKAASEAAAYVHAHGGEVTAAVLESANRRLHGVKPSAEPLSTEPVQNNEALRAGIGTLKRRVLEQPRDAISACELSRLYMIAGQNTPAKKWMYRAATLAPNDRYVLRSAAQLFSHLGAPAEGLDILWKSDSVRNDPWVQAAEVALADQAGRTPRCAHRQRSTISDAPASLGYSELAVGLGSLEEKAGAKRRIVRRLLEKGLAKPTENALAQGVWLKNRTGIDFRMTNTSGSIGFAGEAKALSAAEAGEYAKAVEHCDEWLQDEPYSIRALITAGACTDTFLRDHDRAIEYFSRGLLLKPDDSALRNGLLVACAYSGRLEEARNHYSLLDTERDEGIRLPYIEAARGLIAFKSHQILEGRLAYMAAVVACRKIDEDSLALKAKIYWIEQEVEHGSISPEQWEHISSCLGSEIAKSRGSEHKHVQRLWAARRQTMSEEVLRQAACATTGSLMAEALGGPGDNLLTI